MKTLTLLLLSLMLICVPAQAQDNDSNDIVFVTQGDVVVADVTLDNVTVLVDGESFDPIYTMRDMPSYEAPVIAPDNSTVFFKNRFDRPVYVTSLDGGDFQALTDMPVAFLFDVAFRDDRVLVPISTDRFVDQSSILELWSMTYDGSMAEQIGEFRFLTGCGGGPSLPDIESYNAQAGFQGNPLMLIWLDDNTVLTSMSCIGLGIQSVNLETGEATVIDDTLSRVVINGTRIAGITMDQTLRIIDLETGITGDYDHAGVGIDRVAWLPDGRLVFSTVMERDQIALTPQDDQLAMDVLYGMIPETVPLYTTALYLYAPETGDVSELWTMNGWRGLPVITATDEAIYFSAIPDMETMVTALNTSADFITVVEARPTSSIYMTALDGDPEPVLLVEGGEFPTVVR